MEVLSTIAGFFQNIPNLWHSIVWQHFANDHRVKDWPLMSGPHVPALIMIGYILMVVYGPSYMESRKPAELKPIMRFYNLFQVLLSAYIFSEFATLLTFGPYPMRCSSVDRSEKPHAMRMVRAIWLFMVSKVIDMLDTVFLVLRKKYNQISFLHVYHHCSMVANFWGATYAAPGGHTYIIGILNSLVHVIMYSYYYLSSLGPQFQKYLWWKRYLTQLQLVQFFAMLFLTVDGIYNQCNFPPVFLWWVTTYLTSLVILFSNFYVQEYVKQQKGTDFVSFIKAVVDNGGNMRTLCIQKLDEDGATADGTHGNGSAVASSTAMPSPNSDVSRNGRVKKD